MKIEHHGGEIEVADVSVLERVLELRDENGANEFWMRREGDYPALSVLARGPHAYVHFFPKENHAGFQVLATNPGDSSVTFIVNGDETKMDGEYVVTTREALQAAIEFLRSGSMAVGLLWGEL